MEGLLECFQFFREQNEQLNGGPLHANCFVKLAVGCCSIDSADRFGSSHDFCANYRKVHVMTNISDVIAARLKWLTEYFA